MKKFRLFRKLELAVLMLNKNSFSYHDQLRVLTLELPDDTVRDLEVIDQDRFTHAINTFITSNTLTHKHIVMIVNDALFFKKTVKDEADFDTQREQFLENVPFEHVASNIVSGEKGSTILVANKDYFEPIINSFVRNGCIVPLVLPDLVLEKFSLHIKSKIDGKTVKAIQKKFKVLEQYNLLTARTGIHGKNEHGKILQKPQKTSKKRMSALLTVFVLLSAFLISMIVSMKTNLTAGNTEKQTSMNISPTVSPNPGNSSAKTVENSGITIAYSGQKLLLANSLKVQLTQLGFTGVSVESADNQDNTSKTSVTFSLNYPEALRQEILAAVNKTFIDVVVDESNAAEPDVVITVGQGY